MTDSAPPSRAIGGRPWRGGLDLSPPHTLPPVEALTWRLRHDLLFTFATFVTILGKSNRPVAFHVNRTQRWVLWNIMDQQSASLPVRLWILKGRQFGMSTFFMMRSLVRATICSENCLTLVHQERPGQRLFAKAETALRRSPSVSLDDGSVVDVFKQPRKWDAGNLMFWDSPDLNAVMRRESAENRDAGVSETYQNVHLSEVPLYPDADHTLSGLLPTIPAAPDTSIVGEFTARATGDYTHETWLRAAASRSLYRAVFLPWYWHEEYARPRRQSDRAFSPEERRFRDMVAEIGIEYPLTDAGLLLPRLRPRHALGFAPTIDDLRTGFSLTDEQMLWRRDMIDGFKGDIDKWRREYPSTPEEAFVSGGRRVISPSTMDKVETHCRPPLPQPQGRGEYIAHVATGKRVVARWMPREDGAVHRFEMPRAGATYLVWADPSSGAGQDPTGAGIWRVEHEMLHLALSFVDFVRPHELARLLSRFGRHYRDDAHRSPRSGKLTGGRESEILVERSHHGEAVLHELSENLKYRRIWRFTDRSRDNFRQGHDFGFPITRASKMPMLQHAAKVLYDGQVRIYDRRVIDQFRILQYLDDDDKTAGAPKGAHDDLAMGGAEGIWAATQKAAFKFKRVHGDPRIVRSDLPPMFDM